MSPVTAMTEIRMPALSDSMQEGTILTWLLDDGAAVSAGQELAEIETDKATMTYEAEGEGTLEVVVPAGSTVSVGEVIARLGSGDGGAPSPPKNGTEVPVADDAPSPAPAAPSNGEGVTATPMARRIAAVHGVELGELHGSGPRGRVVRADVMRAAGIEEAPAPAPAPSSPPAATTPPPARSQDGDKRIAPTRTQALIARRMAEAKATIPHFQVETEVEMTAALGFREQLKALAADDDRPAPSLNDLIVKACALCLRRFPRANGSYTDGGFILHARVNVGIAVAAQDALVVPVIHDADTRSLGAIASVSRELAAAVRDGSVTASQLSGATFTVSNLGMYGMTAITPVINPPQAGILGVGAIRDVLTRAADGDLVDAKRLTLRLSCDHRILYGADAARFLAAVADLLQAPAGLAL